LFGFAICCLLLPSCGSDQPELADSNTVLIIIDAQRADHLGCYGYPEATSPEMDRLARRGMLFERAYTSAPWTYSATASLVTGLYPPAHGAFTPGKVRNHTTNPYPPPLSPSVETIAEVLYHHGWRTALFSANSYVGFGVEQGFETYSLKNYDAQRQSNLALRWIEELAPKEKFFAIVHYIDVHEPNHPPRLFRKMFPGAADVITAELRLYGSSWGAYGTAEPEKIAGYADYKTKRVGVYDASIRFVDEEIGRLVRRVEEVRQGQDNTFIVLADHGEEFWDHNAMESKLYKDPRDVYGLAHGHSFFEELMRIPLIFYGGWSRSGRVSSTLVSMVDVVPTMLEYFGIPRKSTGPLEGRSLMSEFRGESLPQRTLLLDALVYGRDKRGTVDERYKLIASDVERTVLFDLIEDPGERTDLAEELPRVTTEAVARLDSLYTESLAIGKEIRGEAVVENVTPTSDQVEVLRALGYVQ
jgi:arylsulfatase